jgi:hypothetical protein
MRVNLKVLYDVIVIEFVCNDEVESENCLDFGL